MANEDKVLVEDKNGEVSEVQLDGNVDYSTVQAAVKQIMPVVREHGNALGETIGDQIEKSLERIVKAREQDQPINAQPVSRRHGLDTAVDGYFDEKQGKADAVKTLGLFSKAMSRDVSGGDVGRAHEFIKNQVNDKTHGRQAQYLSKVLEESKFDSLGLLVPEIIRDTLKMIKDDAVVMRQISPTPITVRGNAVLPKELSLATAYYADESEDLTISDFRMGQEKIILKKLTVLIATSNELLQDGTNVEQLISRMMARVYRLKEDSTFIRSVGSNAQPKGLLHQVAAAHKNERTASSGTATVAEIHSDLVNAIVQPREDNHEADGVFMMNSTTWGGLWSRLTTDYHFAPFAAELMAGRVLGKQYYETNAIPNNLDFSGDATNDESEVYYLLPEYSLIFESDQIYVDASRDATYKDANSNDVSAFSRDQSVYRYIGRHDYYYEYEDGASVIQGVDW